MRLTTIDQDAANNSDDDIIKDHAVCFSSVQKSRIRMQIMQDSGGVSRYSQHSTPKQPKGERTCEDKQGEEVLSRSHIRLK